MRGKNRGGAEVNSGSMADIAFLLLIFFLVTTTIASDKGILITLPPKPDPNEPPPDINKNQRNIFKILANSSDRLLVEDEPFGSIDDVPLLRDQVKEFVTNFGRNPELSDNPIEAVVSFKADRGTSYELYLAVLDELQAAYNEMYGERVATELLVMFPNASPSELGDLFRELDNSDPAQKEIYDKARKDFPRNISIAQPSNIGG